MSNTIPTVSVIMATHNTPHKWLKESIESILNQTFIDFEFIIVDDCSSMELKPDYDYYKDSRIKWIINEENIGLTKSLNIALKVAKGRYIARMDADDIALSERLQIQVNYMERHSEVIVCGSYRRAFGKENKDEIWNLPKTREEQQVQLFFANIGLTHPTAMFRKEMLDMYGIEYNESYRKAQDYGIWVQCTRYAPMAMIPKVLLLYRKSDTQITNAGKNSVLEMDAMIKCDQLSALGISPTESEKKNHVAFCRNQTEMSPALVKQWLEKLKEANNSSEYFNNKEFIRVLNKRWYRWCKKVYIQEGRQEAKREYFEAKKWKYIMEDWILYQKAILVKILGRKI